MTVGEDNGGTCASGWQQAALLGQGASAINVFLYFLPFGSSCWQVLAALVCSAPVAAERCFISRVENLYPDEIHCSVIAGSVPHPLPFYVVRGLELRARAALVGFIDPQKIKVAFDSF